MNSTRESYRVFPRWTSRFWTWLTGKPELGQTPLISMTPALYASCAVATYIAGLGLGVFACRLTGMMFPLLLLTGWTMTVNGARRMISTVAHQCIHGRFSGDKGTDLAIADWFAIVTLTPSAADYRREHFELHHRHSVFTTTADPAARFLWETGFRPGKRVRHLWLNLCVATGSPRFHGLFFARRIRSLFTGQPMRRRLSIVLLWSAMPVLLSWICTFRAVVAGIVIPVTILYQISVLLEFISEHAWFVGAGPLAQAKYVHGTHSWGRFCGRRVPTRTSESVLVHVFHWIVWFVEHALYHLPVRLIVLPGDLSQHDFHHRHPSTMRWPNATFAREADVRHGDRRWPPYTEFWGLHHAIAHVFEGISAATSREMHAEDAWPVSVFATGADVGHCAGKVGYLAAEASVPRPEPGRHDDDVSNRR